jgi:hypothetical protein
MTNAVEGWKKLMTEIGQNLSKSMKPIVSAFEDLGQAAGSVKVEPLLTAAQIAAIYDVPEDLVSPPGCVNHSPYVPADAAANHLGINAGIHAQQQGLNPLHQPVHLTWDHPDSDPLGGIQAALKTLLSEKKITISMPWADVDQGFLALMLGTDPPEDVQLFHDEDEAPYGWFCDHCGEHMAAHTGDPVACDSAGTVRPATSTEHKRVLLGTASSG